MRIVALPLIVETLRRASALGVLSLVLVGACSMPGTATSRTPTASSPRISSPSASPPSASPRGTGSPGPSPAPVTTSYGILVSAFSSPNYTVSLVGSDGRVVASAQTTTPGSVSCANAAAALVAPPVSASNARVYYMDAQGVVRYLAPNGDAGRATSVPIGPARRSMFAVSPDDQRIAVIVDDFDATGAATRLYVEDLNGGGHHLDLYSQTGAYTLWPTGWHGTGNLVLSKVPSCTQGGGPGCCGPQEFHVVDPGSAVRRFTVGDTTCKLAGAPSPAGVVCETDVQANVLTWTGTTTRSFSIQGPTAAHLSPNGSLVAISPSGDTIIQETSRTLAGMQACGWIDDTNVLSGGDAQHQPRVGDVTNGNAVAVAAQGDCAGRLPGGL
jgi:hypothetical protein